MRDEDLREESNKTIRKIQIYEAQWHIFKAFLLIAGFTITLIAIVYYANYAINQVNQHVDCVAKLALHSTDITQCKDLLK